MLSVGNRRLRDIYHYITNVKYTVSLSLLQLNSLSVGSIVYVLSAFIAQVRR